MVKSYEKGGKPQLMWEGAEENPGSLGIPANLTNYACGNRLLKHKSER